MFCWIYTRFDVRRTTFCIRKQNFILYRWYEAKSCFLIDCRASYNARRIQCESSITPCILSPDPHTALWHRTLIGEKLVVGVKFTSTTCFSPISVRCQSAVARMRIRTYMISEVVVLSSEPLWSYECKQHECEQTRTDLVIRRTTIFLVQ